MMDHDEKLGEVLTRARKLMRKSLVDAAEETRVSRRYLEALEGEVFSDLPGEVSAKGFIKIYCDYLNLDSAAILEKYADLISSVFPKNSRTLVHREIRMSAAKFNFLYFIVLVAAILILGVYVGRSCTGKGLVNSYTTASEMAALKPLAPSDKIVVSAEFLKSCWTSVSLDGKTIFRGIIPAGRKKLWEAKDDLRFKFGNGAAVRLFYNGKDLGVLGREGQVVTKEFVSQ
jgi:cytoskeletal protein RodZ